MGYNIAPVVSWHVDLMSFLIQDAVTTCCESMDELQRASEGGQGDADVREALGSMAGRLGQAEKALHMLGEQQVGNSSRFLAMAAQGAHLQGGLEDCSRQLASLQDEVRSPHASASAEHCLASALQLPGCWQSCAGVWALSCARSPSLRCGASSVAPALWTCVCPAQQGLAHAGGACGTAAERPAGLRCSRGRGHPARARGGHGPGWSTEG